MELPDPRRPRTTRSFPPQSPAPRAQFTRPFVVLWAVAGILLLVVVAMLMLR